MNETPSRYFTAPTVFGLVPQSRHTYQVMADTERALYRLAVITPPGAENTVKAEVTHRTGLGMSLKAAYESVADDIITARWMP